ncbi:MAG TPA: ROK family protein [Terriglobales bacterium]|nr:ROK family protein [Terriglobales bacterium]
MRDGLLIGVDIGGTKIAAGIVTRDGEITSQIRMPMIAHTGPSPALAAVISAIDSLCSEVTDSSSIKGIGLCAPGPLDPKAGIVINPPNLPCWRNFPLNAEVAKKYNVPVTLDNDGNAAALAEARWGAGRGYGNVFYATIGTGIGTGIIFDGKIYHGRTGAAAEGGHISIDYRGPRCGCGKTGCIEVFAAGPAIAKRARAKLAVGKNSTILDLASGNVDAVTSEMVGKAYLAEDAVAREVLLETIDLLSVWIGNTIDLLEPDVIVIGGGASTMLVPLFDEIRDRLPGYCVNSRCQEIPLVKARYGADAGIVGGAALCSD